jgi:hypothetical protein
MLLYLSTALATLPIEQSAASDGGDEVSEPTPGGGEWFRLTPGPQARVLGGEAAEPGDWPPVAVLFTPLGFACSGTLVTSTHVLTAGHCAYGLTEVRVGGVGLDDGQLRAVRDVVVHPEQYSTLDLAVVELDAPIDDLAPAHFADGCLGDVYEDGLPVVIAGFGATDDRAQEWPDQLRVAETTVGDADCSVTGRGCNAGAPPATELIAGGDGVDSCAGDSGGPLFLAEAGSPVLVGVTSRAALPSTTVCGDGGIYVRADAAAAWLRDDLGLELPSNQCDNTTPVVEPLALTLTPGGRWEGTLAIQDDAGQQHTVEPSNLPLGLWAEADGDRLSVWMDLGFRGEGTFDVRVSDDGVPSLHANATVTVTALAPPQGCASVPAGSALAGSEPAALLALLAALSASARRVPGARRRAGSPDRRAT